jgi:hypothetical protein
MKGAPTVRAAEVERGRTFVRDRLLTEEKEKLLTVDEAVLGHLSRHNMAVAPVPHRLREIGRNNLAFAG